MRRRIQLAILGVAAGSVLLFAVPLGIAVQRLYRDDELIKVERTATAAARRFNASAQLGDRVEFPPSSDALAAYGRTGQFLGGAGPGQPDAVVAKTLRSGQVSDAEVGDRLVVAVPVLNGERVTGAIRDSRPGAALARRVRNARLALGGLALTIVAIAAAAALYLSRRLTRPVTELAASATRLGEGDFAARSPRHGIAELDAVAVALDASAERLGMLIGRERSFSADASHQLRTPLAALRLELESRLLAADGDDPPAQRSLEQVDRLESTIDTLLAAARDVPSERQPFDARSLLEELRETWHGRFAAEGRALRVSIAEDAPRPVASRAVIREALEVLIDNALRHGEGAVSIVARPSSGQLAIEVSDEGRGISGHREAIFARRSEGGHGIGLSLARSLVEAEGGRLTLSDAGPNPTFTVLLRAAAAAADPQSSRNTDASS